MWRIFHYVGRVLIQCKYHQNQHFGPPLLELIHPCPSCSGQRKWPMCSHQIWLAEHFNYKSNLRDKFVFEIYSVTDIREVISWLMSICTESSQHLRTSQAYLTSQHQLTQFDRGILCQADFVLALLKDQRHFETQTMKWILIQRLGNTICIK